MLAFKELIILVKTLNFDLRMYIVCVPVHTICVMSYIILYLVQDINGACSYFVFCMLLMKARLR